MKALCTVPQPFGHRIVVLVLSVANRTDALPVTRRVLCQLSYDSMLVVRPGFDPGTFGL